MGPMLRSCLTVFDDTDVWKMHFSTLWEETMCKTNFKPKMVIKNSCIFICVDENVLSLIKNSQSSPFL